MLDRQWKRREDTDRQTLLSEFPEPGKAYLPYAFWFWEDDAPEAEEYGAQTTGMAEQRLSSGYVHDRGFAGGQSENYYACMDAVVAAAKRAGVSVGYCDPVHVHRSREVSGDDPELCAVSLRPARRTLSAGEETVIPGDAFFAVAVRLCDNGMLDSDNSVLCAPGGLFRAENGAYRLFTFTAFADAETEGCRYTNFLHHGIAARHAALFHETMLTRYRDELGDTVSGFFYDLEGDYGYKLCWSADAERIYEEMTGRSYRLNCPLLLEEDVQGRWMRARYDWYDAVAQAYTEAVFTPGSRLLEEHGLTFSVHLWEERLLGQVLLSADPMRIYRAVTLPGVDHLFTGPFNARTYKEVQSVCQLDGKRFLCEILSVSGWEKTPMDWRKSANNALAMGVDHFVPHGVNSCRRDILRVGYAPDFYDWSPSWELLHCYTDYLRRGSYLNAQGRTEADTLLYDPIESVWALAGDAAFDEFVSYSGNWLYDKPGLADDFRYGGEITRIDGEYISCIERLTDSRVGFLIGDRYYLEEAAVDGGALCLRGYRFRTVVLPSVRILRRTLLEKLLRFLDSGGRLLYTGTLPDASAEEGFGDPAAAALSDALRSHPNASHLPLPEEGELSHPFLRPLCRFVSGAFRIRMQLRRIGGHPFYWLANNTDEDRQSVLFFPDAHGRAVMWSLETGTQTASPSVDTAEGSTVSLPFPEGAGFYLEFCPETEALSAENTADTAEIPVPLGKTWRVWVDTEHQMRNPTGFPSVIPEALRKGAELPPADWREYGLKDFSGFVEYETVFRLPEDADSVRIRLGEVCCTAVVSVDGEKREHLWGPFSDTFVNMTAGEHRLHVRVGNLMVNQLYPHRNDGGRSHWRMERLTDADFRSGMFGPAEITYRKAKQ